MAQLYADENFPLPVVDCAAGRCLAVKPIDNWYYANIKIAVTAVCR